MPVHLRPSRPRRAACGLGGSGGRLPCGTRPLDSPLSSGQGARAAPGLPPPAGPMAPVVGSPSQPLDGFSPGRLVEEPGGRPGGGGGLDAFPDVASGADLRGDGGWFGVTQVPGLWGRMNLSSALASPRGGAVPLTEGGWRSVDA